jgi:hypothetical protein
MPSTYRHIETITKKVAGARCCQPELLKSPVLGKAS